MSSTSDKVDIMGIFIEVLDGNVIVELFDGMEESVWVTMGLACFSCCLTKLE